MKIQSALMTTASGKLGGIVALTGRNGIVLRRKVIPADPATDLQMAARNAMQVVAADWGATLTDAQREAWNLYASNVPIPQIGGGTKQLSGQQMFSRTNTLRVQLGMSILAAAPTTFSLGSTANFDSITVDVSSGLTVGWSDPGSWVSEAGSFLVAQLGRPQSAGIGFFRGPWRFAGSVEGDNVTPPTSLDVPAVDMPFVVTAGQKAWVRLRVLRADGRLSESIQKGPVAVVA